MSKYDYNIDPAEIEISARRAVGYLAALGFFVFCAGLVIGGAMGATYVAAILN